MKNILGKKILDVKRHGKVFWLELEDSYQLGFHFGMTGELKVCSFINEFFFLYKK